MLEENYNAVHGINPKAESKQFTYKTTDPKKHYVWIQRLFHLFQSGIETQVFLEYLNQCVFRSDDCERVQILHRASWTIGEKIDIVMTTYFADNGVSHCNEWSEEFIFKVSGVTGSHESFSSSWNVPSFTKPFFTWLTQLCFRYEILRFCPPETLTVKTWKVGQLKVRDC